MTADKLEKGKPYILTFTKPIYDRHEKKYLPDNFRFCDPHIERVYYGGRCDAPRFCNVCGRKGSNARIFIRESDLKELYVSDHCFRHPATKIWDENTPIDHIEGWYEQEDRERRAEAGDPLAAAAIMMEELGL